MISVFMFMILQWFILQYLSLCLNTISVCSKFKALNSLVCKPGPSHYLVIYICVNIYVNCKLKKIYLNKLLPIHVYVYDIM